MNATEMIHRRLTSSILKGDSGSGIWGCRDMMLCSSAHLDVTRCLAPYEIDSGSAAVYDKIVMCHRLEPPRRLPVPAAGTPLEIDQHTTIV